MSDAKWFVGQVVIETDVNRKTPKELTITKIGRKYVTASNPEYPHSSGTQYEIESGAESGPYRHSSIYTREEYSRKTEVSAAVIQLREIGIEFGWGSPSAVAKAPEILAAVRAVLDEK